jgi:hypothetical protein
VFEAETGELRNHLRRPDSLDAVKIIRAREFEDGRGLIFSLSFGLVFTLVWALVLTAKGVWQRRCNGKDRKQTHNGHESSGSPQCRRLGVA